MIRDVYSRGGAVLGNLSNPPAVKDRQEKRFQSFQRQKSTKTLSIAEQMDPFSKHNLDPLRTLQQKSPKRQSNEVSKVAKYSNIAIKNRRSYATLVDLITKKNTVNMNKSASHKLLPPSAKDL